MKRLIVNFLLFFSFVYLAFVSCSKEIDKYTIDNRPPLANAGFDQVIFIPADTVLLDGSQSTDPENHIVAYHWSLLNDLSSAPDPSTFTIWDKDSSKTTVTGLVEGIYLFELLVSDNGGLSATDTISIAVTRDLVAHCDLQNRQEVQVNLIPVGTLTAKRYGMAVATVGNKIIFAGGAEDQLVSSKVDIYDILTHSWSEAELSMPRSDITTVVLDHKVFFVGGIDESDYSSKRIDIYDSDLDRWSTTELSIGRNGMSGGALGGKVFLAGGISITKDATFYTKSVEVLDSEGHLLSTYPLLGRKPDASTGISTSVVGEKIYFAGAMNDWPYWDFGDNSSTINIYNASNNEWSTSELSEERGGMAAISIGTKIIWAGGKTAYQDPSKRFLQKVEIRDVATGTSTFSCLFQPNAGFITRFDAVQRDNQVIFFTGAGSIKNKFDIYNIQDNSWEIGVMAQDMEHASIISVGHNIYVAGGLVNGELSDKVWKLEF